MASERRWVFIVTVIAVLIASTIYALRQPLEFETGALVRVKTPPLPKEFAVHFSWGEDFWRSPDLAVEVAKRIRISEEPEETWPIVSWLSTHLAIKETDGLVTLTLRGGVAQRAVRDALAAYIERVSEKMKSDLQSSIKRESQRLSELRHALEEHRQQVIQVLTARLEERKNLLHAQRESIEKGLQELLKTRLAQIRIGEQGATVESWYYRNYIESLLRRLENVQRELDLLEAKGVRALEGEYQRVLTLEERIGFITQAQVEARQIEEQWEPLEVITPAQLPQGPVGPDRAQMILWGTVVGIVLGLLVALFAPRRREHIREAQKP
jgi:LPS O-antigen subunit length determinant protein (WzzB/FepE family)